ncbi:DUF3467 domain-containing protein [Sutcliffiella sp. NPDC057660]|uniref:DUF3467 domain-containing protein n=1 Tax=Sutcliffiella sp. NPDC057660 TaxID=3346199 RepID=UPI0036CE751B
MHEKNNLYYSNSVNIAMQLFDLRLQFTTQSPENIADNIVDIYMSPQHAKVFSQLLNEHIIKYEEAFGPIPNLPNEESLLKLQEKGVIQVDERAYNK